jgi:micrococcal nuclease
MKHKLIALLLVLIILTIFASGCNIFTIGSSNEFSQELGVIPDGEPAKVTWIYDGDTVEVELGGREYRVRYIGVDTPEIDQPYYEEASRANFDMVKNKDVILVRDVSDTDQYNRLLRYVYLADGTMVNAELLRDGYGRTINIPPDISQQAYFAQLQAEAKQEERGLWALEENKILPDGCVTCTKNAYDCKDFATQRQAQACFDTCMDLAGEDVHHLDGGGDGVVCESLR